MNTIFGGMICAGGLWACLVGVAIGARAADSIRVPAQSDRAESAVILLDDISPDRLVPLPDAYSVKRRYPDGHPLQNALAGRAESCAPEDTKTVYSSKLGTFAFSPGRGVRIADDLVTELVGGCSICSLQVRVTGGVENGGGTFRADFSLFDGCPVSGQGGQEIPGTLVRFSGLDDHANLFHDLILDYSDRGICDDGSSCLVSQQNCTGGTCADGSACDTQGPGCGDGSSCVSSGFVCVADPLEIPPTVWVRFRFDTDDAAAVMGSPPTRGFSSDSFDYPQVHCTAWFSGWPAFPHATMFAEILAPATCETHFLAYLAANPARPAFLPSDLGLIPGPDGGRPPFTMPTTRLADDIRLAVDNCTLSAYELGMKGNIGEFDMNIDLRWPDVQTIRPETEHTFHGRGEGSAEIVHVTIDENINLEISKNDQPILISWKSNTANTGAMEVGTTQAGTSLPIMLAFDVDPHRPNEWLILGEADLTPAVFYAAIFCRGDTLRGACCPDQPDIPGRAMDCFDDVPVTSCSGGRWLANTTCAQNFFDPPCGTHACCLADGSCENLGRDECLLTCDTLAPLVGCRTDTDCPGDRTCGRPGGSGANLCTPVCGEWSTGQFCDQANFECSQPCQIGDITTVFFADAFENDPPGPPILTCPIDARQPHDIHDAGLALGWDRMVMEFACNAATLPWRGNDFQVTSTSGSAKNDPKSIDYDDSRARLSVVLFGPIAPGEWTCIEHLDSGQRWCAGALPGDADQNRLVSVGDIHALINAINIPPAFQPPIYATDINRSGRTTPTDILRLIDLLNGADEFEPWITRSLPPCPTEP